MSIVQSSKSIDEFRLDGATNIVLCPESVVMCLATRAQRANAVEHTPVFKVEQREIGDAHFLEQPVFAIDLPFGPVQPGLEYLQPLRFYSCMLRFAGRELLRPAGASVALHVHGR